MVNLRNIPLCVLAGALFVSAACAAQQPAPAVRIAGPIDEGQLVPLKGNIHPAANARNDRGPVSANLPMADLVLVLSRAPEQQAAFDAYVESEYDSGSPNYHQWLTPDQVGQQFGPAPADIATLTSWLSGHGFQVSEVSKDRMTIRFSGTAGQVESAFHTQIHNLEVNGAAHIGNMTDPQIPATLAPVIVGIKALHDFHPRPLHRMGSKVTFNKEAGKWQKVANSTASTATPSSAVKSATPRPLFTVNDSTNGLEEDVSPSDFAAIYNVQPLWTAGITGSGQTIAIAGTSDINLSSPNDVATFRSAFGLPVGLTPQEVRGANGIDPGICTNPGTGSNPPPCTIGDLEENTLDVEASGEVATGAQIVLVTSGYTAAATNDPIYQSSQYVVDNHHNSSFPLVANAGILSVSYGLCELAEGTAGNVSYYDLWQAAAAEGIAVFVATGDSASATCDDGGDANGNPYSAQFGLSVSGLASTPFNTAVGGTDFKWCNPTVNSSGNVVGCSTGSPYWNSSNTSGTNASAAGYVPEKPWNDSCEDPIWAAYLGSVATFLRTSGVSGGDAACNYVENNWNNIYESGDPDLASFVDTVGGSGGPSNCVANDGQDTSSCYTASTTGASNGSITLHNDGWVKPSWQTGVTGIPGDGVRDIPDISFFAGDGSLGSATLICLSNDGACTYSSTSDTTTDAQEVGGTSVATPQMAGVMALINQKAGAPQGSPNAQLYKLAGAQTYSGCSAESVKSTSASCYFNDIDTGNNATPCSIGTAGAEGGSEYAGNGQYEITQSYTGLVSPNCTALNSGDTIGTLVSSGSTPGYSATTGFDVATGLGSLNVANVVNAWASDVGTAAATVSATLSASTIAANTPLTVTVTVTGASGTPTGSVVVSGDGANATGTLTNGSATITIAANTLAVGSDTLTINYSGDSTYAPANTTATVTVSAVTPTVTVSAPSSANIANPLTVSVGVAGPLNSPTPTGTVTLAGGGYNSTAVTLSGTGTASFTIPANTLAGGNDTLTATYSGNSSYTMATGTAAVTIVTTVLLTPTVTVAATPTSIDTSQGLSVAVTVGGSNGTPTGVVSLTSGSTSLGSAPLVSGAATIAIAANKLAAGTATLTAAYSGDATYAARSGTANVTVTQSVFALSATTPAAVAPGSPAASTITGTASSTDYTGAVTLGSCTVAGPANAVNLPTCSVSGTITYASGTATGSGTATVSTSANTAMIEPVPGSKGWLGAGGGAVLAFLVFLGIPARRRSWRAMLGALVLLAALGSLTACGGGGGGTTTTSTATTAGNYTFTVTGTGNDPAKTTETTTFTLMVN